MTNSTLEIDQLAINTIRTLSMDAVQQANSGHPGTPMALAPLTYSLWTSFLNYDPANPNWMGRDRFVLSCGHASMLLYSVLHLAEVSKVDDAGNPVDGPSISLEDIRNFRQLISPCAGHPEYGYAAGIETTTGPLGQGLGNSVGMAIAGKWLAATYDKPGFELFGFDTYAVCSDGDIMEGIGCEAASLAGHLKLSNLCWVYDDNEITIEGRTELAFSEDVAGRFESVGWNVVTVEDANDLGAMEAAYSNFKSCNDKPTLIVVKSIIGYGAPNKQDTSGAHGSPLGEDEIKLAKEHYGWPVDEKFTVPDEVLKRFRSTIGKRGADSYAAWSEKFSAYQSEFPEFATQLQMMQAGELPEGWEASLPEFPADAKGMASRASSGKVLNSLCGSIPWLIGGSADLAGSNKSNNDDPTAGHFSAQEYSGKNFHFGIREHAMAAASNGMSLCGIRAYCATFFVFTDYLRPSLRLSSIMHQPVLYIMTHDSIGLGEDGPTHQPVEHLAACRSIPGVLVMRPGDANEVSACYKAALSDKKRPAVMVLSRQDLPTVERADGKADAATKGAYVLQDCDGTPDAILMGTGSEVQICIDAAEKLTAAGKKVRVVSVPCWELFDDQSAEYRESVLPAAVTNRVACEAGIKMGWEKYIGAEGTFIGMESFGASGPFEELYEKFGITPEAVAKAAGA